MADKSRMRFVVTVRGKRIAGPVPSAWLDRQMVYPVTTDPERRHFESLGPGGSVESFCTMTGSSLPRVGIVVKRVEDV